MTEEDIKNLQQLLSQHVGPNKKVVRSDIGKLTAPGENYLSVVLRVDVVLKDEGSNEEEKLSAVAKCLHSGSINEMFKNFGKIHYKTELIWYTDIVPTLRNLVKEKGLESKFDIFPELIAYRANLHGENDEVDDNAVLLLNNITVDGYENIDRHVGFDYDGAKIILKDLAIFHAVPLALKLKKRQLFEEKVKKNLIREDFKPPEPKEGEEPREPPGMDAEVWFEVLETREECKLYIPRLRKNYEEMRKNQKSFWDRVKREPFATISHNDMWMNNTMQVVREGEIVKNKFVDFQVYSYDSPGHDLLFFIWSSVQLPVIKKHFNEFLKHYYNNFMEVIQELGCDCVPFTYAVFEEELKISALNELIHNMMMSRVIYAKKGEFAIDMSAEPGKNRLKKEDITEIMRERAAYTIQICGRRGWI